jgi:hypothetical protein
MQYERSFKDLKSELSPNFQPKMKLPRYSSDAVQLLYGRQVGRERQLARRITDVHLLLGAGDNPVLRSHVPVGQITAVQGRGPLDLPAGGNGDTVEGTEDSDRVILATKGDILKKKG